MCSHLEDPCTILLALSVDWNVLQILPLALQNCLNAEVRGAVVKVSRVYQRLCAREISLADRESDMENATEALCLHYSKILKFSYFSCVDPDKIRQKSVEINRFLFDFVQINVIETTEFQNFLVVIAIAIATLLTLTPRSAPALHSSAARTSPCFTSSPALSAAALFFCKSLSILLLQILSCKESPLAF